MGLYFFDEGTGIYYGLALSILASIGFCGSLVFYNAYLPEIASKDRQDMVSARGFAMGYIGSVILLVACLALILMNDEHKWFQSDLPARWSLWPWVFGGLDLPKSLLEACQMLLRVQQRLNYGMALES